MLPIADGAYVSRLATDKVNPLGCIITIISMTRTGRAVETRETLTYNRVTIEKNSESKIVKSSLNSKQKKKDKD